MAEMEMARSLWIALPLLRHHRHEAEAFEHEIGA